MRPLIVVSYDPTWPGQFQSAASELRQAVGKYLVEVHHIGSTAIKGMAAKPVIDILLEVSDLSRMIDATGPMKRIGYQSRGENGITGRHYFTRDSGGHRSHQIHAFQVGHPAIIDHLVMRDFLATHAEEASAYAALKIDLAKRFHARRDRYVDGKAPFLAALRIKARAWNANRGN